MTQEEKLLLLQDLCARLPFGIWFQSYHSEGSIEGRGTFNFQVSINTEDAIAKLCSICNTTNNKPYLRPMSSMTEEERTKLEELDAFSAELGGHIPTLDSFDYLNSIHVDYRGLIYKKLALEAPEGMYNLNKE